MEKNFRVQFVVSNFGQDDLAVTKALGFPPTSVVVSGGTNGHGTNFKAVSWHYRISGPVPEKLEDHVNALLKQISPFSNAVRLAADRFKTQLSIAIDDRDFILLDDPDGPRLGKFKLSRETLAAINQLRLVVEINFWSGWKDDEPEPGGFSTF